MGNMVVFRYNKKGYLTDFVSKDNKGEILHFVCVKNNTFFKYFKEDLFDPTSNYREITVFSEDFKLHTELILGEYWVKPIGDDKKYQLNRKLFLAASDTEITNFSVKPNHITDWTNKLRTI